MQSWTQSEYLLLSASVPLPLGQSATHLLVSLT